MNKGTSNEFKQLITDIVKQTTKKDTIKKSSVTVASSSNKNYTIKTIQPFSD